MAKCFKNNVAIWSHWPQPSHSISSVRERAMQNVSAEFSEEKQILSFQSWFCEIYFVRESANHCFVRKSFLLWKERGGWVFFSATVHYVWLSEGWFGFCHPKLRSICSRRVVGSPLSTPGASPIKILQRKFYAMLIFKHPDWLLNLSSQSECLKNA